LESFMINLRTLRLRRIAIGLAVGVAVTFGSLATVATSTEAFASAGNPAPRVQAACSGTLAPGSVVGIAATSDDNGYWIANNRGMVVACGDATNFGGLTSSPTHPVVGIAATADGNGYYLVASDGGIFAFGNAIFHGSTGAITLNKPVVGMGLDPETGGYWMVASDGGIFAFGAPFRGSTGNLTLNKPVVGMGVDPQTEGYWLVASDGGIFAFNAPFHGSTGAIMLNRPMVGMSPDTPNGGYWLVAADGGIFAFNAPFFGSTGALTLNQPITGMEANESGTGYRFVAADGGIFSFGASQFFGSATAPPGPAPVPPPGPPACSVTMSNSAPPAGGSETATVASNVANSSVNVSAAYKTTTSTFMGQTDAGGNASITFGIGHPTVGFTVVVTVTVGNAATCSSSFTPQ
jgi:ribosomal protein L24E